LPEQNRVRAAAHQIGQSHQYYSHKTHSDLVNIPVLDQSTEDKPDGVEAAPVEMTDAEQVGDPSQRPAAITKLKRELQELQT